MKHWARVASVALALVGCIAGWVGWAASGTAPTHIARSTDKVFQAFGTDPRFRCWRKNGTSREFVGERECYSFGPPQRFQGIYFDEFEGHIFLPDVSPAKSYALPREKIWLSFDEKSGRAALLKARSDTNVWYVEIVGRKTIFPGGYGHFGQSDAEILIDEVLSAKLVQSGRGYLSCELIVGSCKF